jgi:tripartite ATP-independent transporter DctP family solute receptor
MLKPACLGVLLVASALLSGNCWGKTLRAADSHPEGYPTVEAVKHMGELLSAASGDELNIRVYPGRQLGEERDTLEQTVFGAVDINRLFLPVLNNVVKETNVLTLPFIFRSIEHFDRVLRGPIGKEILTAMEPYGLIGLVFYDSGVRSIYTNTPVRKPEDLNGLRIRVPNSDVSVAMIEALGANATPMEFGQIYEAIRNGAINGAENNIPAYSSTGHFEVAPYFSLTEHSMVPEVLVMSKQSWDKLSTEHRRMVREAAEASVDRMRELWNLREQSALERVQAGGAQIIRDVDKEAFVQSVQPVYDQYAADPVLADLVRRIQETGDD